jgi:hypothetical protein
LSRGEIGCGTASLVLDGVARIVWAHDLVCSADVAIVSLDALAWLKEVPKYLLKILMLVNCPAG